MNNLISTQLIIADVLRQWPETIPVFLHYETSCVGCSMAAFDTIGDAMRIYGLPEAFLEDLERALREKEKGARE